MIAHLGVYFKITFRARICKRLRSPGIDSKESIPPAYVVWRAGMTILQRLAESIPGLLKRLQIRALLATWHCFKFNQGG